MSISKLGKIDESKINIGSVAHVDHGQTATSDTMHSVLGSVFGSVIHSLESVKPLTKGGVIRNEHVERFDRGAKEKIKEFA